MSIHFSSDNKVCSQKGWDSVRNLMVNLGASPGQEDLLKLGQLLVARFFNDALQNDCCTISLVATVKEYQPVHVHWIASSFDLDCESIVKPVVVSEDREIFGRWEIFLSDFRNVFNCNELWWIYKRPFQASSSSAGADGSQNQSTTPIVVMCSCSCFSCICRCICYSICYLLFVFMCFFRCRIHVPSKLLGSHVVTLANTKRSFLKSKSKNDETGLPCTAFLEEFPDVVICWAQWSQLWYFARKLIRNTKLPP